MKIAAVILAAGGSSRLGHPKQLVRLHGETLLDRAIKTALDASCSPIVAVLGAFAEEILAEAWLENVRIVINDAWIEGVDRSLSWGVHALAEDLPLDGVIVMNCDQPAVTQEHLHGLIDAGAKVAASDCAGRLGFPAYFPQTKFGELMMLRGDTGAEELLGVDEVRVVSLPGGELDVNSQDDVDRLGEE